MKKGKQPDLPVDYESLDRRYVPMTDRNVDWLKTHGFREVVVRGGVVDHYEYKVMYQFRYAKKCIVLVCVYPGWTARAFPVVSADPFRGVETASSQRHDDVRNCLMDIQDSVDDMEHKVDTLFGHGSDGSQFD